MSRTSLSGSGVTWFRVALFSILLSCVYPFTAPYARRTIEPLPKGFRVDYGSKFSQHKLTGRRNAVELVGDAASYDPYDVANNIEPETKSLPQSMTFYARFVVEHFVKNRKNRKSMVKVKGKRRAMWKKLNEQRKNIMSLAGYTSHIVAPSFLFLFLGALMTSVVPSYYSKCIHCVSTLSATRGQLLEAIIGLGASSILAALFTGLRGSLFWIGGKCSRSHQPTCYDFNFV